MLTDNEIEKLKKNQPRDKNNDFIVRRKFKTWLAGLWFVYNIIFRYLPDRQLNRTIQHDHIIHICNILLHILSKRSVPIIRNDKEYTAVPANRPPRPATSEEILMMNMVIKPLLIGLFRFLSVEEARRTISDELLRNQPEYMMVKKI